MCAIRLFCCLLCTFNSLQDTSFIYYYFFSLNFPSCTTGQKRSRFFLSFVSLPFFLFFIIFFNLSPICYFCRPGSGVRWWPWGLGGPSGTPGTARYPRYPPVPPGIPRYPRAPPGRAVLCPPGRACARPALPFGKKPG